MSSMGQFQNSLINETERYADEMANQWCDILKAHPKTPRHNEVHDEECLALALNFYRNMREIYFGDKHYSEVYDFFTRYAEIKYEKGFPLDEIVYSLILMRRNIWIYADFNEQFFAELNHHQILEIINKTLLIFDRGIYIVIKKVEDLKKEQ